MSEQLLQANLNNAKPPLESVLKNLETLLSAWKVAVSEVQRAQAKGLNPATVSVSAQGAATSGSIPAAPAPSMTSGVTQLKPPGSKGF
jgi:hypothetical protein